MKRKLIDFVERFVAVFFLTLIVAVGAVLYIPFALVYLFSGWDVTAYIEDKLRP